MDNFLLAIEILGVIAFSVSGAVTAIHHQTDIFGVVFLALVTSFGGGILRDLMCGIPLAFFTSPTAVIDAAVCIGAALVIFFTARIFKKQYIHHEELIASVDNCFDALGLGFFAVYGTQIALSAGERYGAEYSYLSAWPIAIFLGMVTGIVGGMIRDICLRDVPFVLRKRVYALAAIAGAAVYYLLRLTPLHEAVAILVGTFVTFALRISATVFRWNMPVAVSLADFEAENVVPRGQKK